jgi:diketogulonate reductase-like aldo/keto reductase
MEEASALPFGKEVVTDQVLYNLAHRGIEWDLLPWCRERRIPIMAYSPIEHSRDEQKGMLDNPQLKLIALQHDATPAQIALAWLLQRDVVAIPKASRPEHVKENRAALDIKLTEDDFTKLDWAFPPPRKKVPLEVK